MAAPAQERVENEIVHGQRLAAADTAVAWGWGTPAGRIRAERRARMFIEIGQLREGVEALEIGCGTGIFTEKVAASGCHVTAVDLSPDLLAVARARNLPPDQVEFVENRFESYSAEGRPFDVVYGSSVLHHLVAEEAFPHIHRLLKPGGRMVFTEPNMLNPQIFLERHVRWIGKRLFISPDETAFVRWTLARLLRGLGFVDVRLRPFDWLHPWTPRPLIPAGQWIGAALERVPLLREISGSLLICARGGNP